MLVCRFGVRSGEVGVVGVLCVAFKLQWLAVEFGTDVVDKFQQVENDFDS